jgi:hypothetical protein
MNLFLIHTIVNEYLIKNYFTSKTINVVFQYNRFLFFINRGYCFNIRQDSRQIFYEEYEVQSSGK